MRQVTKRNKLRKVAISLATSLLVIGIGKITNAALNDAYQLITPKNLTKYPGIHAQGLRNSTPRKGKRLYNKKSSVLPASPQVAGQQLYQSLRNNYSIHLAGKKSRSNELINAAQQDNLNALNSKLLKTGGVKVLFDKKSGVPTFIKPQGGSIKPDFSDITSLRPSKQTVAMQFMRENRALLKLADPDKELVQIGENHDKLGKSHLRFQQTKNGVPIWGKQVLVHLDKNDDVYLFQGHSEPTKADLNTNPKISVQDATNTVLADLNVPGILIQPSNSALVIYAKEDGAQVLSFKIEISPSIEERWLYFVNAETGAITRKIFNIQKNVVSASGVDLNGQNRIFNAWFNPSDSTYYLIDPSTPTVSQNSDPVIDGPQSIGDTYIYSANNSDVYFQAYNTNTTLTNWQDPVAVSAAYNTRQVYDYYLDTFGRNSIDDSNENLLIVTHFNQNYDNAFWNGISMVYGDGGSIFSPLAGCLDVAGHEMTHGVIESSAGLIYENQSGALNESFADVFGAMIDRDDWLIAEDCTLASPGYLRNLEDPGNALSSQPSSMAEYQNLSVNNDNGGVHINSGIPNRAAYLIAEGLTTEGLGTSIGRNDTEQIYYRALTTYLTPYSQFIDTRRALIQAAEDLFGQGSTQTQAVSTAFDVVGITDNGTTTPDNPTPTSTEPVSGDDVMLYLYPTDGTHDNRIEDFDLYAQTMANPFTGYDANLDVGPYNFAGDGDLSAFYTKPAAYTDAGGTIYLYVASNNNIYLAVLNGPDIQLTTTADFWSITISPDGRYIAYTTTSGIDNNIYIIDLDNGGTVTSYPVIPEDYQDDSIDVSNTVLFADSLSFDYTSNIIVFDALSCLSTPQSLCSNNAGYRYWSVGLFNINKQQFFFPFPNQSPDIDLGFPSFAANNNYIIALDFNNFSNFTTTGLVESGAIAIDFEQQSINSIYPLGTNSLPFLSVPTFWGGDDFITMQVPQGVGQSGLISASRRGINSSWQGTGNLEAVNIFAVAMPLMHRAGERILTGGISPDNTILDFGNVAIGSSSQLSLTLSNTGNSDVNITNITSSNTNFTHSGVNTRVPRNQSITFDVTYTPTQVGTQAGNLVIENDGVGGDVIVSLTATTSPPPEPDISVLDFVDPNDDLQIDFGDVIVGETAIQLVSISNNGNADLNIGNIGVNDSLLAPFSLSNDNCSAIVLTPTDSCPVSVNFTPAEVGQFNETFGIPSNDPDENPVTVSISGTGLAATEPPSPVNNPPSIPELVSPADGAFITGTSVTFEWNDATDPDGDPVNYEIIYCDNPAFTGCTSMTVASVISKGIYVAALGTSGTLLFGLFGTVFGSNRRRIKDRLYVLIVVVACSLAVACGGTGGGGDNTNNNNNTPTVSDESFIVSGLVNNTTYYWKVIADDGKGGRTETAVRSFTTQ